MTDKLQPPLLRSPLLQSPLPVFLLHPNLYQKGKENTFVSPENLPYKTIHEAQCEYTRFDNDKVFNRVSRWIFESRLRVLSCVNAVRDTRTQELFVFDMILSGLDGLTDATKGDTRIVIACLVTSNGKRGLVRRAKKHMQRTRLVCNREYCFFPTCIVISIGTRGSLRQHVVS